MFKIGSLIRTAALAGCAVSTAYGVVALTAPSSASAWLTITEPDPLEIGTAFGVAVLLMIVFLVLRPRGCAVTYEVVRHDPTAEVHRPIPKNLRPKVGKKVREKVRAAAGRSVVGAGGRGR